MDSAQDSDSVPYFGDLSQNEKKKSEIKAHLKGSMQYKGCFLSDGLIFPSIKPKFDNISSWNLPEYHMLCSRSKVQIPAGAGQIFSFQIGFLHKNLIFKNNSFFEKNHLIGILVLLNFPSFF